MKSLHNGEPRKFGAPKPFYALPISDLESRCNLLASALRTLSDQQLAAEMRMLEERPVVGNVALSAVAALYRAETARRSSPLLRDDGDLDAALSRLERQTTAVDRDRVRQIGEQLHRAGGMTAVKAAIGRMTMNRDDRTVALRTHILHQRWAGLV